MNVDTSDRTEQRKFGIVMAIAITALGMIRWGIHWGLHGERPDLPIGFFIVAAPFLVLGVAAPGVLRPVFVVWMKFALGVNWVMTRVFLSIALFVLFLPTRLIMVLFGHDPLHRKWDPAAATYWVEAEEQPTDFERYKNQF